MRHASSLRAFFLVTALLPAQACRVSAQNDAPAVITGRVTFDDGRPATGEAVVVRSTDYVGPTPSGTAVTDAEGRYAVAVQTGLFLSLFAGKQSPALPPDAHFSVTVRIARHLYLEPSARAVTLAPARRADSVDFVVTTGPKVTVRVHDALTGLPVRGVQIQDNLYGSGNGNPTLGVTDAHGIAVFRLTSLHAELTLPPAYGAKATVQAAPGYDSYKEIRLQEVQDVPWDVKTYPIPPPATALWRGMVLQPDGRPAVGATVHILRRAGKTTTQTDSSGRFSVALSPLGTDEYSGPVYRSVALLAEQGDETALLVPTADAIWNGMTLRLTDMPLSSITGVAVDASGQPEAGVRVSCWDFIRATGVNFPMDAGNGGVTDAAGRFTVSGLPEGHYVLNLGGGSFGYTTVPMTDPRHRDWAASSPLPAGRQEDLGRIVVPIADQSLAGRIVTDTGRFVVDPGRPNLHNISIEITGAHTSETVEMDADGHFHASGLVDEPLTLTISAWFPDGLGWTIKKVVRVFLRPGPQNARVVVPAAALPPHSVVSILPTPAAAVGPR